MRIKPFVTYRPAPSCVSEVASLPYDVGELKDARALAVGNPKSFLHVERPEVDLPADAEWPVGIDHQTAATNLKAFLDEAWLIPDREPSLYLYRIQLGEHVQTGVVACCHIDDYESNRIKKHEKTKKPVEDARTQHVLTTGSNTGPIFLTYRDEVAVDLLMTAEQEGPPLYDFTAIDGIRHTVWKLQEPDAMQRAFGKIECTYVADGHHRTAAAARAGLQRRANNPGHTGEEEYNWFLTVLFPASHLKVIAYNRAVEDLHVLDEEAFLARLREVVTVRETEASRPQRVGAACMVLGKRWYELTWPDVDGADPVSSLDVSILQDRVLGPILGVDDPRNNSRVHYFGGFDSVERIATKVSSGEMAVGFSMFPTTVEQLMAIADADRIMPPKSTWFEPKLRSGLFVHPIDGIPDTP
ncbi:MAG: DUF1015 domain-containing protein [Kiritimatiellae bacterium]|nr:DUF1015 domain-containing protein [Kiritimatiellia bacterium]